VALLAPGEMQLLGRHNVANALTASVTAALAGASVEAIRTGLRSFRALPHRLEPVGERDGVLWVNDSKATNVAAARSAVLSLVPAPMQTGEGLLVLLLGGMDKRESLDELGGVLPGRVRAVVCYGAVGPRFADALEGLVPVVRAMGSFDQAVAVGAAAALPGDLLLLAPATSSYDQFRNYGERGDRFRALARGEA
jgi:UDP-N-acetylmuramoylalanine--D-glutamate ligase